MPCSVLGSSAFERAAAGPGEAVAAGTGEAVAPGPEVLHDPSAGSEHAKAKATAAMGRRVRDDEIMEVILAAWGGPPPRGKRLALDNRRPRARLADAWGA